MKLTIKNILTSLSFHIITIICGFIVPKLIISNYGSDVNGVVASITQFLAYITLLEAGFGPVIKSVLFKPIANNDKKTIEKILKASEKIFRRIAYLFIVYLAILCVVLPMVLSKEFDTLFTISLLVIIAISTFSEYFFGMTYKLFLHANQKSYVTYSINTITLILNTIAVVVLVKVGASIQIVKLVGAFIFLLRPLVHNFYVKKKYNINIKDVKDDYVIKQKWDALSQHISYIIFTNTDIILLTLFSNMKEVSVYSICMLIFNSIRNVTNSFVGNLDASFGKMIAKENYDELNKKFDKFVNYYYGIATILYASTFFLIIPFIELYTKGITDANYIRPVFAYLMLGYSFVYSLKVPYYDLVKVAGKFKETNKGAWIESILNIGISLALIFNFGIIGVAIGTLVATIFRTIQVMYFSSRNILNISFIKTMKKLFLIVIEVLIIYFVMYLIGKFTIKNYYNWILYGTIVFVLSLIVVFLLNFSKNKIQKYHNKC